MSTNSEQTVSGATQGIEYAGFWARVAAYFVDYAIVMILFLAIAIGLSFIGDAATIIGMIVFNLIMFLYWPVMESSARQATFGKSLVGIKVTDLNGGRLSFVQSLLRNIAKILSAIPAGIGFLLPVFTKRKQALHDMLAKCLVVRTGPSHLLKAIAAAVGGLVLVIGCSGAYFYYIYLPQMQEATKGATTVSTVRKQPVAKAVPPAAATPAAPEPAVVAKRNETGSAAVATALPVSAVATTATASAPAAVKAASPAPTIPAVSKPDVIAKGKEAGSIAATASAPAATASSAPKPQLMTPDKSKELKPELDKNTKGGKGVADASKTDSKAGGATPVSHVEPGAAAPAKVAHKGVKAKRHHRARKDAGQLAVAPAPVVVDVVAPEPEKKVITVKFNDLITAVMYQDQAALKELLDLGWWVDKPDPSGVTPLMAAVKIGDAETAELLLKHGANPNLVSSHSDSALSLAKRNKDAGMTALLQRYGATVE